MAMKKDIAKRAERERKIENTKSRRRKAWRASSSFLLLVTRPESLPASYPLSVCDLGFRSNDREASRVLGSRRSGQWGERTNERTNERTRARARDPPRSQCAPRQKLRSPFPSPHPWPGEAPPVSLVSGWLPTLLSLAPSAAFFLLPFLLVRAE